MKVLKPLPPIAGLESREAPSMLCKEEEFAIIDSDFTVICSGTSSVETS